MIGRRTAVGLSLLCALLFSAIAVQSASAAKAVNTTAFTCVSGGGKDFSDAHCDTKVTAGTGSHGHVALTESKTSITVDNTTTGGSTSPANLKSKAFGAAVEITCHKVHGEGTLENVDSGSSKHTVKGTVTVKYTECTVTKPTGEKCIVDEPIEVKSEFEGVENGETMGVEFKGDGSETFVEITFRDKPGKECPLKNQTFPVKGSAVATGTPSPSAKHSGATAVFTDAMTTETLKFGESAAGFDSIGTVKRVGGNPIALTTTT